MPKFLLLLISIWVYLILLSNLGLETSGCGDDRPSITKFVNQCDGMAHALQQHSTADLLRAYGMTIKKNAL
uniref:Uncharacterized protein n=1 Tax=Globodera pallida TaxID=36090 RepID=A0A183BRU0_GLOPA